ncbi:MAG: AI-2E family transporter [Elusimicrobiota bacterium]
MEPKKSVLDGKKFSKYFLLTAFALSLLLLLSLVRFFVLPIMLAIIIAILIYPLFKLLLMLTKNRRALASILCCILILTLILLPLMFVSQILIAQSIGLYRNIGPQLNNLIQQDNAGIVGRIMNSPVGAWLVAHDITMDWQTVFEKTMDFSEASIASFVNRTFKMTVEAVFGLFITLFSLFYFLRDGETILLKIKDVIPLTEEYKDRIIFRFYSMSNATVKGILLIALLQGSLATLTLWIFGIKGWLLWGLVLLILSVIPFIGTGAVLVPAGIIKIVNGDVWQGVLIIIISVFFISVIDNILRPRIVGRHAGMHDLLVFFSMIGGIVSFGPAGLLIGPLIAAIFLSILEIYKIEFQHQIKLPGQEENSLPHPEP